MIRSAPLPHRPDTSPGSGAAPRATEHHCAGLRGEAIASADLADERVEAFQDAHHLRRGPFTVAARCRNALRVESFCDGSQGRFPGFLEGFDGGSYIGRPFVRALL